MTRKLPAVLGNQLPPILAGNATPDVKRRVEQFYFSVASAFEAWVTRRQSHHTQRAYREDVMSFVKFLGIEWPGESWKLLSASIKDVQAFRDELIARDLAPKTVNRRISSLSSFYKYLAAAAAELRLPITVPNPAHAQFIARQSTDPRDETRALTATRALEIRGKALGSDHPDVATSLNNLATVYGDQDKYAEAEPLHKRALEIQGKALGSDHPRVKTTLENYAVLLRNTGRDAEAERMEARAKAIRAKAR